MFNGHLHHAQGLPEPVDFALPSCFIAVRMVFYGQRLYRLFDFCLIFQNADPAKNDYAPVGGRVLLGNDLILGNHAERGLLLPFDRIYLMPAFRSVEV